MIEPGRESERMSGPRSGEEGSESGEEGSVSGKEGHRRSEDTSPGGDRPDVGGGERQASGVAAPGEGGKDAPGNRHRTGDKEEAGEKVAKKEKKKKIGTRTRGVETMFRSAYRAHLDLTALADTKANIMISINGLILSIILASIGPRIDSAAWLIIPTVIMLIGCVVAIIFAVLAARPRVSPSENLTLEEAMQRDANLLFFGNASQLTEEEFLKGLRQVLSDRDAVYRSMMRDLYGMARVLTKKFALLRTSYTVFMIGIATSVLAFIIVFVIQTNMSG